MSIVYLIGAGPGDPGLITVRGQQHLAAADVVLYDHLVPARLLHAARPDAELIDVGTAAPQPMEQEAICYLLAEKAREGKSVARLKWGDPFVFGSGGAEALFLHEQGVPFAVVPGIPAGIAMPAYAGIPITYPGGGDTVTFIRGHEDEGRAPAVIDWTSLARLDGTLVCYAGSQQLPEMLTRSCRTDDRPTIRSPSSTTARGPTQQTIAGTLRDIAREHRPGRRSATRDCWWSGVLSRCGITCAGSTCGRCSGSASWSPVRAIKAPISSTGSKPWARMPSKHR